MKKKPGIRLNQVLADRYGRWLVAEGYAPATRSYYASAVTSFLQFLKNKLATKTTQVDVQEYVSSCAAGGCAPYKLRERLYALRIFFDFLCLGGLMRWSPPRLVKMRRLKRELPYALNRDEIKKVFAAAKSPREKALVETFYGTGIRSGEALSVQVRDIDFRHRKFRVQGKRGIASGCYECWSRIFI